MDVPRITVPIVEDVARTLGWKPLATTGQAQKPSAAERADTTIPSKPGSASEGALLERANGGTAVNAVAPLRRKPALVKPALSPASQAAALNKPDVDLRLVEESNTAEKPEDAKNNPIASEHAVAVDANESPTGRTGTMRLEDLDDRLAETFFSNDPEMVKEFRRMADEKSEANKD